MDSSTLTCFKLQSNSLVTNNSPVDTSWCNKTCTHGQVPQWNQVLTDASKHLGNTVGVALRLLFQNVTLKQVISVHRLYVSSTAGRGHKTTEDNISFLSQFTAVQEVEQTPRCCIRIHVSLDQRGWNGKREKDGGFSAECKWEETGTWTRWSEQLIRTKRKQQHVTIVSNRKQ